MQILERILSPGPDVFYDPKFRNVLEDHMTWLRNQEDNHTLVLDPANADVFEADLWGALQFLQVPAYLHWTVMRMNHMYSPTDYRANLMAFIVPREATVEQLRSAFKTQHSMKK